MIISSCHKDVNDASVSSEEKTQITTPYIFQEIEGSIFGYVYGDDDQPIADAVVSTYSGISKTNEYGVFHLKDVKMDGQGTLVKVSKEGFFDSSDFVFPNDNGSATGRIQLSKADAFDRFESGVGASIVFSGEGLVTFISNSIANQNGSTYTGLVDAYIRGHYPEDPNFNDIVSGSLMGLDSEGRNRSLAVYGSMHIRALSPSGELLQMKSQDIFTIKFPIPHEQWATAPSTIIIWKHDESTGFWVESGRAIKEENFYISDVTSFGKYMVAEDYALVHFCARLIDNTDLPAKNYNYNIYINDKLTGVGISDDDGFICAKLPFGEELQIQIQHPICSDVLLTKSIGPYLEPSNEGDILIDVGQELRSGSVYCNEVPVSEALIIIKSENNTILQSTDAEGLFNINLGGIICNEDQGFELFAIEGDERSPILEINSASSSEIMFEICKSDCEYEVSFDFEKEDYCTSGQYNSVTALVEGGSGDFSFSWSDGGSSATNNSLSSGLESCVTVTDLASGCIVEFCELVSSYTRLDLLDSYSTNVSCTQDGGVMTVEAVGGRKPYEYLWTGDNGYTSEAPIAESVPPGIYQVIIRDSNQCEVDAEVLVYDVTKPLESEISNLCDFSTIAIVNVEGYGPFDYSWSWANGTSGNTSISVFEHGEYSVTVSDANGCIRTKSIEIVSVGSDFEFNANYFCEEGTVYFTDLDADYEYYYQNPTTSELLDLTQDGGEIALSILETGYNYNIGAQDLSSGCEEIETITLPHFEGLRIENVEDVSCDTCMDGHITVLLDADQDCTGGCVIGEVIIIDKLTSDDVTDANEQSELGAGTYIAIVIDENMSCYIAHEEVIVE